MERLQCCQKSTLLFRPENDTNGSKGRASVGDRLLADEDDIEENELVNKDVLNLLAKMVSVSAKKILSGLELNRFKGKLV